MMASRINVYMSSDVVILYSVGLVDCNKQLVLFNYAVMTCLVVVITLT